MQAEISERKRTEVALLQRNRQLDALARASQQINAVLEIPTVLRQLVAAALELTGATGGAAGRMLGNQMVFTEYNRKGNLFPINYRFGQAEGVPGLVLQTHEPYLSNDTARDPRVLPEIRQTLGFQNLADVPILDAKGALLGCFEIHNKEGGFQESDLAILQSLAATAAIAMENARLVHECAQTEETLRDSEERYRLLFERNPHPMWVYDFETLAILEVNKSALRRYGYSREEFLAMTIKDIRPPEDVPTFLDWRTGLSSGLDYSGEWRHRKKDGSIIDVEIISHEIPFDGRRARLVLANDITERKRAEEAQREARQLLRGVLDTVPVRVFWKDRESRFLGCNLPFARDAGFRSPDDLIGKTDLEMPWHEQADLYRADDRWVTGSGLPKIGYEEPQTTPTGGQIWLRTSKIPLKDEEGKITGVLGTYEEITERKRAEKALRDREQLLSETQRIAHIGSWRWDPPDTSTWSDEAYRVFGVSPETFTPTPESFINLLHPEDRPAMQLWMEACAAGHAPGDLEFRVILSDGSVRLLSGRGELKYDAENRPAYMAGTVQDITERKRAEDALRETKEQLAQANRELENKVRERTAELRENVADLEAFSYTIAHDMRAPLRAILGFTQLLRRECQAQVSVSGTHYFNQITDSVRRMDHLIQDVLTLSRVTRTQLKLDAVDVDQVLHGILNSYPAFQQQAQIQVEGRLPVVLANEAFLTLCLSNLLGNAVKFVAPAVTPRVEIWAEQLVPADKAAVRVSPTGKPSPQPVIRLWIADNGIGIAPDQRERIFEIFQRLDTRYEGTGIGLAIVRKAMHRMGGEVGLESEPGKGSRFWLAFLQPKREKESYGNET